MYACMPVCMKCMPVVCMYDCMYACMTVCMYDVCMHVCLYAYVCLVYELFVCINGSICKESINNPNNPMLHGFTDGSYRSPAGWLNNAFVPIKSAQISYEQKYLSKC